MLVLTRKPNQEIRVGEGENAITITVVRISPTSVRVGITAPRSMEIIRPEIKTKSTDQVFHCPRCQGGPMEVQADGGGVHLGCGGCGHGEKVG